jgi:AraC-like DNA-binding protein
MNITFEKRPGNLPLNIAFFWKMTVEAKHPAVVTDNFIPELYFDFLFVEKGKIRVIDEVLGNQSSLPRQSLKSLHTHPVTFIFSPPLVLYGARLAPGFAESFQGELTANSFLTQAWAGTEAGDLDAFKSRVEEWIESQRVKKLPYPMFSSGLQESSWLIHFSPRHKRRLYKSTFGMSRKELQNIHNLHVFLEQTCDFGEQSPRIIQHVNPDVFYDQPHLNHAFKKMTGLSPGEYFEKNSILQDNLMSASYNEVSSDSHRIGRETQERMEP